MSTAPAALFFQTPEQRTALARQRFFDDGQRPSGLVGEAVLHSWQRCAAARRRPGEVVAFEPVSRNRVQRCLDRNQDLLTASRDELSQLASALAGTPCRVLLTDAQGVVVHASEPLGTAPQPVLHVASRVGVNLGESVIGTAAPGIVARLSQPSAVSGAEHFHEALRHMHCVAAPIRNAQGQLAGVLDISSEGSAFAFDATALAGLYASTIENRLLRLQSPALLVLQFQTSPRVIDTPLEALAGVDEQGRVVWRNAVAQRLTPLPADAVADTETVFGTGLAALMALHRERAPRPVRLPNGLTVWMRAHLGAADGADFNHAIAFSPPATPPMGRHPGAPAGSLRDQRDQVIVDTLAACEGNVARAARELGVSRGLLYRRLRAQGQR